MPPSPRSVPAGGPCRAKADRLPHPGRSRLMTSLLSTPTTRRDEAMRPDFLAVLRRSDVLGGRQFEKVAALVRCGRYPGDPLGLASKLVRKGVLTEYQARRLLGSDRPSLVFGRYVILDRLG